MPGPQMEGSWSGGHTQPHMDPRGPPCLLKANQSLLAGRDNNGLQDSPFHTCRRFANCQCPPPCFWISKMPLLV